jgi:hypothetical protein
MVYFSFTFFVILQSHCLGVSNDSELLFLSDYLMRRDRLTMGYFDNLDDGPLKKYKKFLKIKKKFIDVFFYFYIDVHLNFM